MPTKTTECPCKEETPAKLAGSPEPDRVVTMVHGTFAKHAEWTHEGPLCEALKAGNSDDPNALPGTTLFSRFCWTGRNSHTARLEAGENLTSHLNGLTETFPNARHYVIGHSHGGNVMLYAMKKKDLADRVTGLITLATPFLTLRRRKLHSLVRISIFALILMVFIEVVLSFTGLVELVKSAEPEVLKDEFVSNESKTKELVKVLEGDNYQVTKLENPVNSIEIAKNNDSQSTAQSTAPLLVAGLFLIWVCGTVLSALLYRGQKFGFGKIMQLLFKSENAEDILTEELKRLKLTGDREDAGKGDREDAEKKQFEKMFVARPIGDEASMSLIVSQFFSWAQNRILTGLGSSVNDFRKVGWFSWIWKGLIIFLLSFLIAYHLPNFYKMVGELIKLMANSNNGVITLEFVGALIATFALGGMAILSLFGLVSLFGLLFLLVAGLAFGPDAMFWSHFASTTAESSPPGPAHVYLQSPEVPSDLAHSGIYKDANVIEEIVAWIRSREAALADASASAGAARK